MSPCGTYACGTYAWALGYALCSASMLILNKWALNHFPVPAALTLLQCGATALVVVLVRVAGALEVARASWAEVWSFLAVPALFALALYTSSQLLHAADAGFQILVRTTTPVAVCAADYAFMGYEPPSTRSAGALLGLVLGALFYFRVEARISPAAAFWAAAYFCSITTEMVWVKHILNRVRMSTWTRVMITNSVTALIMVPFCLAQPERGRIAARLTGAVPPTGVGALAVTLSCVAGSALSFCGFKLRESVSATSFTLIGVVCKFATVLVNQLIWAHHGSPLGALVLCGSILLSTAYVAPKQIVAQEARGSGVEADDDNGSDEADERTHLVLDAGGDGSAASQKVATAGSTLQ